MRLYRGFCGSLEHLVDHTHRQTAWRYDQRLERLPSVQLGLAPSIQYTTKQKTPNKVKTKSHIKYAADVIGAALVLSSLILVSGVFWYGIFWLLKTGMLLLLDPGLATR